MHDLILSIHPALYIKPLGFLVVKIIENIYKRGLTLYINGLILSVKR